MLLSSLHYTPGLHCITPPSVIFLSSISISLGNPHKRSSFSAFHKSSCKLHSTAAKANVLVTFLRYLLSPQFHFALSVCSIPFNRYPCFFNPIQRYTLRHVHPNLQKRSVTLYCDASNTIHFTSLSVYY
jgi:hypothetical protein